MFCCDKCGLCCKKVDKDGKLMDDLDRKYNVLHSEAPNLKRVSSEVMHGIQS